MISAVKGSKQMSFVYNDAGLRVSKTVGNTTTYYVYDGDLLLAEYTDTQTVAYIYDANGLPIGFKYRSSSYTAGTWDVYWYEKNLQGDVVAIYNSIGTKLISYKYNAWGVTTKTYHSGGASTTAIHNNLTYRGYYYDTDLAMYYLQSRYYDPAICRFINADAHRVIGATPECLTDKNLFAYCDNNPVMRFDYTGEFWGTLFDIISLGLSIVDVVQNPDDKLAWLGLIGDVVDLLPIVSGLGETTDLLRIGNTADNFLDAADALHNSKNIAEGTIDTYKNLRKVNKGNGMECHHIIEKRFVGVTSVEKPKDMLSIALTPTEHRHFTASWREKLPYGRQYERDEVWNAAQEIYQDYPRLLEAARKTIWG